MRLPSLSNLAERARDVALRFPLVLVSALAATVALFQFIDGPQPDWAMRLFYAGSLGIALFTAAALFGERFGPRAALAANLVSLATLVLLFAAVIGWRDPLVARRFVQLALAFHLLVAVIPYLRGGESNGFWHYNKSLFMRFLTAALYSAVLFSGLSVALLALDQLLGIRISEGQYARLWFVVAFMFNTWFFLGGVPDDFQKLDQSSDYPTGLKVFSQFILVPIVTLYLVILTVYLGKVAVTRVWPSGWIGYLVSSVSVLGILSLLLVHPVRDRAENRWVAAYARWFYVGLLPAVAMLILAIAKRVNQYGITENRYFLLVLAGWLAVITLTFIFRPRTPIKIIPATLCLVALATSAGPWGAYAVSEASQTARLAGLLERNDMLAEGSIRPASEPVPDLDRREISSIVRYLTETHGVDSIRPWFPDGLADVDSVHAAEKRSSYDQAVRVLDHLGLEFLPISSPLNPDEINLSLEPGVEAWDIAGYTHLVTLRGVPPFTFRLEGQVYRVRPTESGDLELVFPDSALAQFPLAGFLEEAFGDPSPRPRERMTLLASGPIQATLALETLSGRRDQGKTDITFLQGNLAFRGPGD